MQIPANQLCRPLGNETQEAKNRLQNRCYSSPEERTKEFRGDLLFGTDICSSVCTKRIYQKLETSDSYPGCQDTAFNLGFEWILMRDNNFIFYSHLTD